MATAIFVPVDQYLRGQYEPDAEYVDGEIEERPMGQFDHASWQQAIQLWFAQHAREWNECTCSSGVSRAGRGDSTPRAGCYCF